MDTCYKVAGLQVHLQGQSAALQRRLGLVAQLVKERHKLRILLGKRRVLRQHGGIGEVGGGSQQAVIALPQHTGIRIIVAPQSSVHIAQGGAELGGYIGQHLGQELRFLR